MKKIISKFTIALTLALSFVLALPSQAAFSEGITKVSQKAGISGTFNILTSLAAIVNALLGFTGALFLGLIIYGGILYMTSAGKEEQIKKAKKFLSNSVIGIVIVMSAYTITYFLATALEGGVKQSFRSECEDVNNVEYNSISCCEYRFSLYTGQVSPTCCRQTDFYNNHKPKCDEANAHP